MLSDYASTQFLVTHRRGWFFSEHGRIRASGSNWSGHLEVFVRAAGEHHAGEDEALSTVAKSAILAGGYVVSGGGDGTCLSRRLLGDGAARAALKVVRTSGGAHAATLVPSGVAMGVALASWSPDGQWIAWQSDDRMWHLISPDGRKHRDLAVIDTPNLGFSKDGRTAYGIRNNAGKFSLFSLDIATARLRDIRQLDGSLEPRSPAHPGLRFSVAPDGKSFAYSIQKGESSVWMLQGF